MFSNDLAVNCFPADLVKALLTNPFIKPFVDFKFLIPRASNAPAAMAMGADIAIRSFSDTSSKSGLLAISSFMDAFICAPIKTVVIAPPLAAPAAIAGRDLESPSSEPPKNESCCACTYSSLTSPPPLRLPEPINSTKPFCMDSSFPPFHLPSSPYLLFFFSLSLTLDSMSSYTPEAVVVITPPPRTLSPASSFSNPFNSLRIKSEFSFDFCSSLGASVKSPVYKPSLFLNFITSSSDSAIPESLS